MSTIGERVAMLVEMSHSGSVNAAAKAIGMKQPSLHSIITGRSKNPRATGMAQIARFYGVPLDWLIEGNGSPSVDTKRVADTLCAAIDAKADAAKAAVRERLGLA